MKNTNYYFAHDYEAASDPKIFLMLLEYGAGGYGLYWRIIELLHKNVNHLLPRKDIFFLALAKQLLLEETKIKEFIDDCINKYELFSENDKVFFSERVLTNLKVMEEKKQQISKIRKAAGKNGGIKSGEVRKNGTISEID